MDPELPLSSIRVVEIGTSIAGPYCGLVLSMLGADVVKVEAPATGDDTRAWGPPFWKDESPVFLAMNAGKRSVAVDLKHEQGVNLVRRLASEADVVIQNLRPGLAERLGLGFDRLSEGRPRLVYCTVGSFGHVGPLAQYPGYDPLMQAATGIMSITGEPGRPPVRTGPSIVDQGTGLWAALAILAALRLRDAGAGAQHVQTSLFETAVNWVPYQLLGCLASGRAPGPFGSGISILAPYEAFETEDGWVMIAVGNDRLFRRLCETLDVAELADDPRFGTNGDRVRNRDELADLLRALVAKHASSTLVDALREAGVPASPVLDLAGVAESEQVAALDLLQRLPTETLPELRLVAAPVSIDGKRFGHRLAPPLLGEHSVEVLRSVGYSSDEIVALIEDGVVRAE